MQQEHLFFSEETNQHAIWTMADAVDAGTPVDPESGDDFNYVGPVIHRAGHHIVAVDSIHALCILDISSGRMRRVPICDGIK